MSISNVNGLPNLTSGSLSSSSPGSNSVKSGAERDMFMTLLVAQLKNQDPLAPQDGAQFVAQLAQFNSLEQLTGMRQTLEQLLAETRSPLNAVSNTTQAPKLLSASQI